MNYVLIIFYLFKYNFTNLASPKKVNQIKRIDNIEVG